MNILTIIRYTFEPYFDGYFENGNFYDVAGRKLKVRHYNGRNCINASGKILGIKKLRTFAKRIEVQEEKLPF